MQTQKSNCRQELELLRKKHQAVITASVLTGSTTALASHIQALNSWILVAMPSPRYDEVSKLQTLSEAQEQLSLQGRGRSSDKYGSEKQDPFHHIG